MNHYDYMMQKRENTICEFNEVMQLNGMFKDLTKIRNIRKKINEGGD
jgi:hypothetical protein